MDAEKKTELKRVLCKVVELYKYDSNQIEFNQKSATILELNSSTISTNYGSIKIKVNYKSVIDYSLKISSNLAQNLGTSIKDYVEIFRINDSLYITPILARSLREYFYNIKGSEVPRVIVLSSHTEFEPFTRQIASGIHSRLIELSVPSVRIEIRKHIMDWNPKTDATVSRYEVDITRKEDEPQIIARKLVNKNYSYRILAQTYFKLISKYLHLDERVVVVDIHGIATASPKGIIHPMIIVGDALSKNLLVKKFTKTIEKASRSVLPNLWIVYNSKWGAIEYSLHLVKITRNIPIIFEIRRDLRENPEIRAKLIDLIGDSLENLLINV